MPLVQSITTYFKDAIEELKKVSWPSRRDTINNSLIVIGVSLGVAIFFGILDYLLTQGLTWVLSR